MDEGENNNLNQGNIKIPRAERRPMTACTEKGEHVERWAVQRQLMRTEMLMAASDFSVIFPSLPFIKQN